MEDNWVKTLLSSQAVRILAFLLFFLLVVVIFVGLFTNKHIKLAGVEFNEKTENSVTTKRDTVVKYVYLPVDTDTKYVKNPRSKSSENSNEYKATKRNGSTEKGINERMTLPKSLSGSKPATSKYNFQDKIIATNLQIGDNNTQNNFGIQPRNITDDYLKDFFAAFPDTTMHIGFVAPTEAGEIINVKNQLIKVLTNKGYNNIEKVNGIRIMLDSNLPTEKMSILPNSQGGISFYIPPVTK